mmetsp:Transcript_8720/g.9960  ORF Transcript_8720/g.9960 Transcript_8720/m.9960 type:complete len:113 (+) Transcript_8720:545-883(+)
MMGILASSKRSNDESCSGNSNRSLWRRTNSFRSMSTKLRNSLKRHNTEQPRRRPKYVNGTDLVSRILDIEKDPFSTDDDILRCRIERRRYETNMFEDDLDTYDSETDEEWDW